MDEPSKPVLNYARPNRRRGRPPSPASGRRIAVEFVFWILGFILVPLALLFLVWALRSK